MGKKPQTLRGFRDLLPKEALIKQRAIAILRETFELFGFQPLETPTLESADLLLGKYGPEADKLVYLFQDRGGRKVGLRYDLTVPVGKVLALYRNQLPLPFKRYQIQNVFRAEKPQRGRWREFTQCDIDTFGVQSPLADAEIIQVIYTSLTNLGLKDFLIQINSRQVLFNLLARAGINEKNRQLSVLQSIDKLEKKSPKAVEAELAHKGLSSQEIRAIFQAIKRSEPDEELKEIFRLLKINKIPERFWQFNPKMVRGLDYYTRAIFETVVTKPKIGSITGGGRYDHLIAQLGGPEITGTGSTIGLERIIEVIQEEQLWSGLEINPTKVLVTVFSPELREKSIEVANQLRKAGINTELYLEAEKKLEKQLKLADRKGIPYVLIFGPEELKKKKFILKDLRQRKQKELSFPEILTALKSSQRFFEVSSSKI